MRGENGGGAGCGTALAAAGIFSAAASQREDKEEKGRERTGSSVEIFAALQYNTVITV